MIGDLTAFWYFAAGRLATSFGYPLLWCAIPRETGGLKRAWLRLRSDPVVCGDGGWLMYAQCFAETPRCAGGCEVWCDLHCGLYAKRDSPWYGLLVSDGLGKGRRGSGSISGSSRGFTGLLPSSRGMLDGAVWQ